MSNMNYTQFIRINKPGGDDRKGIQVFENPQNQQTGDITAMLGQPKGASFRFYTDRITVGRDENNMLIIQGCPTVSRYHACLQKKGEHWHVVDLNSTNGTCLNRMPIDGNTPTPLNRGDELRFGAEVALTFYPQ